MDATDALLDTVADAARAENIATARTSAAMLRFVRARRDDAAAAGESRAGVEDAGQLACDEIAVALEMSTNAVQSRVYVAGLLADHLPTVAAAHADGRLCGYRARLIAHASADLHHETSRATLDERATPYAVTHTPTQLRQWLRRLIVRLEPEHAAKRRRDAHEQRGVWFTYGEDATATLHALMPATDALLIERELSLAARGARTTSNGQSDGRTLDQTRADVLIGRLLGNDDAVPITRGAFHIGITVGAETLLGLDHTPGTSVDGRLALDPLLVRELATGENTLFSRLLTDPLGGILDVTELGRFPTAQLERALVLVDGVCAFPTCNASAANTEPLGSSSRTATKEQVPAYRDHHVVPHSRGGPTRADNLIHLCRRHHGYKTRGRLTTALDPHGTHHWRMPTGTRTPSRPHLHRRHQTLPCTGKRRPAVEFVWAST